MNFSTDYFVEVFPKILKGLNVTFTMTFFSFIISLIIGTVIALIYKYKTKILYQISIVYVSFFRGTPVIAQLFFIYFGLPNFIAPLKNMNAYTAATLTIGLNMSAYVSETIRASVAAVDKGQIEAGLSIGMTYYQVVNKIILPQAARIAVPPLTNNLIMTLKGTAVAFTIGVTEVMGKAKIESSDSYRFFECYAVAMIIYWVIVIILTYAQKILEEKLNKGY